MNETRLDLRLVQLGLCPSRERAKAEIKRGNVLVNGQTAEKPGQLCDEGAEIALHGPVMGFVSRGGLKLEKALAVFQVDPKGKVCLDIGASTGGFTDCLLKAGAERVYAVDVGYDQLAQKLREDPRVVNMERVNVRDLTPASLPERPALAVIDVSFISLRLVLPVVRQLLAPGGALLCLIKPQFEAGRERIGKNGVVRDPAIHKLVLDEFLTCVDELSLQTVALSWSPVRGPEGNIEYLGYLRDAPGAAQPCASARPDTAAIVAASHKELS